MALPGSAPAYSCAPDLEERAAKRAQHLCDQGFFAKGVKALGHNKVLDGSLPDVQKVLDSKHIAPTDGIDFVLDEAPLDSPPFFGDDVEKSLRKCSNGAAPSWSGWTKELLAAACDADPLLYDYLGTFLHNLQRSADPRLRDVVRTGLLFAMDNAKHPTDERDPRPITISELFSKILGNLAMEKAAWHLHPSQRGVCHKGGTHQAIVEVQRAYDAREDVIIATFDVRNAFNATRRAAIDKKLRRMGASAQYLRDYFRWMYGKESDIYINTGKGLEHYRSREGVRQGDMVASLLFALAFTDPAVEAAREIFGDDVLRCLWLYCDDVTVVGTVDEVIAFKASLEKHLALHVDEEKQLDGVGLTLNMRKSRALVDRCTEEQVRLLTLAGFQIDRGCTRALGSPVGANEACRAWVAMKVAGWQIFWERLRHECLRPVTALTLLAKCGNVKFEHLAKSLPPDVTLESAFAFDEIVDDTAKAILGTTDEPIHQALLRAALWIRPYAVIAAPLYECTVALCESRRVCVREVVQKALEEYYTSLPSLPFVERHVRAVQGRTAANTFYSSAPVNARPICQHHFAQGMRLRLGVLPARVPKVCDCGFIFGEVPASTAAINHCLTCPHNRGKTTTTRHNLILQAMLDVMATYGIVSTLRCHDMHPHLIPDMHVISLLKQAIIDLTVVDDVHRGTSVFDAAADFKSEKYNDLAEELRMRFFAVPVSTYGTLHQDAVDFIDHLAEKVPVHRRALFRNELRCAIQHALLQGNSEIMDRYLQRQSERAGDFLP